MRTCSFRTGLMWQWRWCLCAHWQNLWTTMSFETRAAVTDVGRSYLRTEAVVPRQEVIQVFCSPTCHSPLPPPWQVTTAVLVAIRNEAGLCDWLTVHPLFYLCASPPVFRPTCEPTRHRAARTRSLRIVGLTMVLFYKEGIFDRFS